VKTLQQVACAKPGQWGLRDSNGAKMIRIIRAKFHGIRVTAANLNYHGSITLDPKQCARAGIYPMESVEVWNKQSGARLTTYVIFGESDSRCCILNGAAARTCQIADELIIAAFDYVDPDAILKIKPRILTFNSDNSIDECLQYQVCRSECGWYDFSIKHHTG
jgi:aspartate 1-decarboxylase